MSATTAMPWYRRGAATTQTTPRRRNPKGAWLLLAVAALSGWAGEISSRPSTEPPSTKRLQVMQEEIRRLRHELGALGQRERGILGDLERLDAEIRLRHAEREEIALRLERTEAQVANTDHRLADLEKMQAARRRYLLFRLREMYKGGPEAGLRRLAGGDDVEEYLRGLGYAAYLSRRDARSLEAYRRDQERLEKQRTVLERDRENLERLRYENRRATERLRQGRRRRAVLLASIRKDRKTHRGAIRELETASRELDRLVERVGGEGTYTLDVRKFRGLLDWPAAGRVTAGFGTRIHPRFRTRLPHPGLDIESREGSDFRSVFEGTVVYADWLRGYGLTAIVDHGHGLISVYAHASVLLAERGEGVLSGQVLGKVGETGSLRGPYLYFEMRLDGKPVDPVRWLRPR